MDQSLTEEPMMEVQESYTDCTKPLDNQLIHGVKKRKEGLKRSANRRGIGEIHRCAKRRKNENTNDRSSINYEEIAKEENRKYGRMNSGGKKGKDGKMKDYVNAGSDVKIYNDNTSKVEMKNEAKVKMDDEVLNKGNLEKDAAKDMAEELNEGQDCSQDASSMDIEERVVTAQNVLQSNDYNDEDLNVVLQRLSTALSKITREAQRNRQQSKELLNDVIFTNRGSMQRVDEIAEMVVKNTRQVKQTFKILSQYLEVIEQNPPETNLINNEAINFLIKYYGERIQKTTQMIQECRNDMAATATNNCDVIGNIVADFCNISNRAATVTVDKSLIENLASDFFNSIN